MADIVPLGLNRSTGKLQQTESGDVLTDIAGTALGGSGLGFERNDITTTTSIVAADSGKVTTNLGASAVIEADLPTTGSDITLPFICAQPDQQFRIDPGGSDEIILPNGLPLGDGKYIDLNPGSHIILSRNSNGDWEMIAWGGSLYTEDGLYLDSERGWDFTRNGWIVPDATTPLGYGTAIGVSYSGAGTLQRDDNGTYVSGITTLDITGTQGLMHLEMLPWIRVRFQLSNAAQAGDDVKIGLYDSAIAIGTVQSTAFSGNTHAKVFIGFEGTANWTTVHVDEVSSPSANQTDTGVAVVANALYELKMDVIDPERILYRMYEDGVLVINSLFTTAADIPASNISLRFIMTIVSQSMRIYGLEMGTRKAT